MRDKSDNANNVQSIADILRKEDTKFGSIEKRLKDTNFELVKIKNPKGDASRGGVMDKSPGETPMDTPLNEITTEKLQSRLHEFRKKQKEDMEHNMYRQLTAEQLEQIERAKVKIKVHFIKFFRKCSLKQNKKCFNKWKTYVEVC